MAEKLDWSGVVVVNKPSGPTSFDVVRRVKGIFKVKRCGHTGTLDPTATGVLPICIGNATKVAGFISDGEKEYEALIRFGETTDTQDAAGKTLSRHAVEGLDEARLKETLQTFTGMIQQTPPMYSARKVDGQRLYALARQGIEVEREARSVFVDEASLQSFAGPIPHPDGGTAVFDASIYVRCSKGTYLRTMAHDLGEVFGCGGHLRALRRTKVGPFGIDESVGLDELMNWNKAGDKESLGRVLLPLSRALEELAELRLDAALAKRVSHGHTLGPADLSRLRAPPYPRGRKVRLTVGDDGDVLAVAESDGVGTLKLLRVLSEGGSGPSHDEDE
jgi:tRNA pseudouridine55 synthase